MDSPDSSDWWDVLDVSVGGPASSSATIGAIPSGDGEDNTAAGEGSESAAAAAAAGGSAFGHANPEEAAGFAAVKGEAAAAGDGGGGTSSRRAAPAAAVKEEEMRMMDVTAAATAGAAAAAAAAAAEAGGLRGPVAGKGAGSYWEEEKARSLQEAVRLTESQALALAASSDQWGDEFLAALVLSKVSSALRTPGRMDMPVMQETARAFEALTSDDQSPILTYGMVRT
ncbi:unnamed protein product [Ectocarpus fasciculatus]